MITCFNQQQEEMHEQQLGRNAIRHCCNQSTQVFSLTNQELLRMKRTLTFLSILGFALLFFVGNVDAQVRTGKGDFFNITRTIEQTADSVTFIADTLTLFDQGGGVGNFANNDSVVVMFVQNRFKIVNNMLSSNLFDYIKFRVSTSGTMTLSRQAYANVVTAVGPGGSIFGTDAAVTSVKDIGVRPFYRPVGNIASSSVFNSGPTAIRQMLSVRVQNPTAGNDGIQIKNILFKPNINNLTGLAVPPDTTKDTLRAYHLDGNLISSGDVVSQTDLAIVRLLPGTTAIVMWVDDSAQAVDAGEYIGSFGDYSRGRYFLGDDGLPSGSNTMAFRPSATRTLGLTVVQNPDFGMMVDGFPPERNPISLTNLYQALAPCWYNENFPATYPAFCGAPGSNPNPENGLIPPYRVGEYAVAHNPYQPGLVSSAVDTLRFYDVYGNRTWDRMTQPRLKALAYLINNPAPEDRTVYLKGYTAADDTLRQYGQIVYRRLAYTHADVGANAGAVEDSVRILAEATVHFTGLGGLHSTLNALADTSGGFPRTMSYSVRTAESNLDNQARTNTTWQIDPNREPVDPLGVNSLPNTGSKIIVRPNIPRAIDIRPSDPWKGTADNNYLRLDIHATDGYGNDVDDNERYKFELSPYGRLLNGIAYRLNGVFDSLITTIPNVIVSGANIDSGRVFVNFANLGRGHRVMRAASGSNNAGAYRIRVRSSYAFNDRFNDLSDPLKLDPNPGAGFSHFNLIPDGSPNNNFGVWFGPGTGYNAKLGMRMGQTVAMDSTDVVWDGVNWHYFPVQPRLEVVCGDEDALVVGSVGTFTLPGQPKNIYSKLYVRITDIHRNPLDIAPYFYPNANRVFVELPDNPPLVNAFNLGQTQKVFFGSVSPNVALSGAGGTDNPSNPAGFDPTIPDGLPNAGTVLNAELVNVPAGQGLPGIRGDVPAFAPYNAVRFYLRAPKNVKTLSLAGTDKIRIRAHLQLSTGIPNVGDFSISSGACEMSVIPDVVQNVEIFKSFGKPQGTTVPMEGWSPISTADALAAGYPTGTPRNAAETNEFYKGYFFRAIGAVTPTTGPAFPTPLEPVNRGIGGFLASDVDLEADCTAPIPMDTITVSEHNRQVRVVARLLDQYNNPVGGRWVKFHVESQTLPVTPPKTQLQNNTQRGGFGEFGNVFISDDTLKRTTIGDTAQAGWVTAYFVSGRVGWQMVRIAMTPDTLAFDLSPKGMNLGEGTIVGESRRGFAPRVIIPIYQKSDTTVRVQIFPYTAAATSPVPLPVDLVDIQAIEHVSIYPDSRGFGYAPYFRAYSANPFMVEQRATHFGRVANTNIRPYIPDTLNLTNADPNSVNSVTAGRTVTLLAREYDKFGNLIDHQIALEDTARIRWRMWGDGWTSPPAPYTAGPGTIAPASNWTRDEFGPMRKATYRHTQISNLVSGVHINQTAYLTALEYQTPKTANATVFFEATGTAVLAPGLPGATNLHRDTVKVVSVVKSPTRFDVLRAGQEFLNGGAGIRPFINDPETRTISFATTNISLPPGSDINNHRLDAVGVDNILISQVYKRNLSEASVGKYEIVNEHNVPLDKDGDALYLDANGTLNDNFDRHPHSGMPLLQKLDAYNNQNPLTSPNNHFNRLNDRTNIPGARNDGVMFDITIAGGGNIANPLTGESIGWFILTPNGSRIDQRPVLLRATPVWENNPPTGGAAYGLNNFSGNNNQPGQTRVYENRLYADSIYTYIGTTSTVKSTATRGEFMGTRSDRGVPGRFYSQTGGEYDRITRLGVGGWAAADFTIAGLANMGRTRNAPGLIAGSTPAGQLFDGDYARRVIMLGTAFGVSSGNTTNPIVPGAFIRLIDSTAEQVLDLRVIDPNLTDKAGKVVDDTCSYDRGKWTTVRRVQRESFGFWHIDDTYWRGGDGLEDGIQGPNITAQFASEQPYNLRGVPFSIGPNAPEAAATRAFWGVTASNKLQHTFVVVPYRIAYTSIFPSSYDISQGLFDDTRLPLGILPVQADIDTLPRVALGMYNDGQHDLMNFEMYTRLYGQIRHGATDQIPNQSGTPYARPDTVFRDLRYTYAVTPYDRYGNLNTRDTMFVQIGSRFTDWEFRDLEADGTLMIRSGGNFFGAIPKNTPTNNQYRQDTLRVFNQLNIQGFNRNSYLGMKPDDKRLNLAVGEPVMSGIPNIPHGLLPANVIASRPVWVKMPFAPAPFTLSTPSLRNTTLFRMDHTGNCANNGIEMDTLRLQWQTSVWGSGTGQNNPNDTIKYEWYGIIDSVGTSTGSLTVSMLADNGGVSPSITIGGDKLRQLLFRPNVQPQPNQDSLVMRIKWFVRAFSKTGLETYSDTAGATIRNNPLPTPGLIVSINRPPAGAPTALQPTNNQTITGISATTPPLDVIWSASGDINIDKGRLIGGFKVYNPTTQTWVDDPSGRTVDTLTYQWVGKVVRTFPVGKGAPVGTTVVRNTGTTTGFQLTSSDLSNLFDTFNPDPTSNSADSVIIDWWVFVKDFNFTDNVPIENVYFRYKSDGTLEADTAKWSRTGCRPHELIGGPFRVNLTKLDQGGVEIEPSAGSPNINKIAGEQICFTLTAKDKNGNVIRDWDRKGQATTLTLKGSTANTDTSAQTWNADPNGFSYAVITHNGTNLTSISANEFSIPASAFVDGVATICIVHTKAENGVTIEVTPLLAGLNQTSATMNFSTGTISNFLVDVTSATANPDQVYLLRRYEIVVSPRDRYLNVSNAQIRTRFTARFPGEFDQNMPGLSDIFSGDVFITGPTNYFLASRIARIKGSDELQWVRAYKFDDASVSGQTNGYEILDHAPNAFALTAPADQTVLKLMRASDPEVFSWVKANPQDPYTNIRISRFDPRTYTDDVMYKLFFVDSISLTRQVVYDSDNIGKDATFTTNHGQLASVINIISGQPTQKSQATVWYVEATDGLYTTKSSPPNADPNNRPGYRLTLIKEGILGVDGTTPSEFALSQNYPNPFNPSTTISFAVPKTSQVTVVVYDLLGTPVKTLVNEKMDAGSYKVTWDATNDLGVAVPSGNYIFKMVSGSFTQTRKMTLLK